MESERPRADGFQERPRDDGIQEQYLVEGMNCSHCVASVTEEVSALAGVHGVTVELSAGGASRVLVTSSRPVPVAAIRAAITEAGYAVLPA